MAASTFDGKYVYWQEGMAMDGDAAVSTGTFVYWLNGMPHTRNTGADVPSIIADIMAAQTGLPPRAPRTAVAYGSQ